MFLSEAAVCKKVSFVLPIIHPEVVKLSDRVPVALFGSDFMKDLVEFFTYLQDASEKDVVSESIVVLCEANDSVVRGSYASVQ